ncbi:MAG: YXWGXW repeat-containing protein [Acidobacteria bacterium]|nr:YXWGXW repeat-containing protein [Acidobacteriota bacterium]
MLLLAFMFTAMTACHQQPPGPPPPPRAETHKPPKPNKHAVWVKGHWKWDGNSWIWIRGHWKK